MPRRVAVGSVDEQSPPTRSQSWAAGSVDDQSPPTRPQAWGARALSDGVVRLEPLDSRFVADFQAIVDDPEILRYTRVPTERGDGWVAGWIGGYATGWEDGARAGFAVVDAADGSFLGFAALVAIDWDALEAEVGYVVAPSARGRGVAARSVALISRWALEDLNLARIEALIDVANAASLRVAERVGYTREGVRRSAYFKDGVRADLAVYSLLPGELR